MTDSYIQISPGSTAFVGPDAMRLLNAITLKHGLLLLQKGIIPSRGWTKTRALARCKEYTGKDYKRTQIDIAIADLQVRIDSMKRRIIVKQSAE